MADTLGPKGMVSVPRCSQINEGYLTRTPGVKQAATDRYNTSTRNWGTLIPLHPATGCENASTRDRGRRRRSSRTPVCNGQDKTKVCQGKTLDRRSVVEGKSGDLGGRRIIKKKKSSVCCNSSS